MTDERPSTPPIDPDDEHGVARKLVERILKRGIESGIGAISRSEDTVRAIASGLKVPKEMVALALDNIDDTKNGLYRAVAKEIRDFLQSTNFANEMKKVLTGLAFEVKMEVRFKNTDENAAPGESSIRPDIKADVALRERGSRRPPPDKKDD